MKESKHNSFFSEFQNLQKKGGLTEKQCTILWGFFLEYKNATQGIIEEEKVVAIFRTLIHLVYNQLKNPYHFPSYHEKIRSPFDYYAFGMQFLKPLVDRPHCKVLGVEHVKEMILALQRKENVILLANHQTEVDPQVIDLLLHDSYPSFGANIIYVAGERVLTDPSAIPFSLGRDLLCIYSKKYIDHPPDLKEKKQLHNKRTMKRMSELLAEGGKVIYVAPSGGRDRKNAQGIVEVAPFDPQSVEMFYLMTKRAKRPAHFFPLALSTYELLPPPDTIQTELGEMRHIKRTAVHLAFGNKITMEHFPGSDTADKTTLRKRRAEYIWNLVNDAYNQLLEKE